MDQLAAIKVTTDTAFSCEIVTDSKTTRHTSAIRAIDSILSLVSNYRYIFLADDITVDFVKQNVADLSHITHMTDYETSLFYYASFFSLEYLSCAELYRAAQELLQEWELYVDTHPKIHKKNLPKNYKKLITRLSGIKNLCCSSSYFNTTQKNEFSFFAESHRGGIICEGQRERGTVEHGLAIDITSAYHAFEPFATYPVLCKAEFTKDFKSIFKYIERNKKLLMRGLHKFIFNDVTGYVVHVYLKGCYPKPNTKVDYFRFRGFEVSQMCPCFITLNALELASLLCDYEMSFTIVKAMAFPLAAAPTPVKILRKYATDQKRQHKGCASYPAYKQGANTLSGKDQYNRLQNGLPLPLHCDTYYSIGVSDTLYTRLQLSYLLRQFWAVGAELCDIATDGFTAKGIDRDSAALICAESNKLFSSDVGKLKIADVAVMHYPSGNRAEWTDGKGRFYKVGGACRSETQRLSELLSTKTLQEFEQTASSLAGTAYHLTSKSSIKKPQLMRVGEEEIYTTYTYMERDDII